MEWKILLYARRKEPLDIPDDLSKYPMNDFELDYWRIVNSAPFRRLQDKTQVFPLDKSDFVRTRLTHSMETSALAKQLATMITANIRKNKSGTPYAMTEDVSRDAANAVIGNNVGRKGKKLWTENGTGERVQIKTVFSESDEANFIASSLMADYTRGGNWRDSAILYRMNAQSNAIEI